MGRTFVSKKAVSGMDAAFFYYLEGYVRTVGGSDTCGGFYGRFCVKFSFFY